MLFDEAPREPAAKLTTRQKHVLALVLESGSAGPSIVSRELAVGLSTAYRDLASLEELGLIVAESGKRTLTEKGLAYLGEASKTSYWDFSLRKGCGNGFHGNRYHRGLG